MAKHLYPWEFAPQLNEERLTIMAKELLKVLDQTFELLTTSLDDNYTRGTCTFGRQKNRIIEICMSGEFEWLKLTNPGMDVTFEIEGIPVRFFADDPENPKKPGFFRRNSVDQLFAPESSTPTVWRFVVEKPEFEGEGARVHFVGYNQLEEILSLWTYGEERAAVLHSTDDVPPMPVAIELDDIVPAGAEKTQDEKRSNG